MATESFGLALIVTAMIGTLALFTYTPSDPIFEFVPVANDAGVVGATLAGLLYGTVGWAGLIVVAAVAVIGAQLILGRRLRFSPWRVGGGFALVIVVVATLPPLLAPVFPSLLGSDDGGSLGGYLAYHERTLLSTAGGGLVNGFLLLVGVLSVLGVSTRNSILAIARGIGFVVRTATRTMAFGGRSLANLTRGSGGSVVRVAERLRVWRQVFSERRARRARVVSIRGEDAPVESVAEAPRAALPSRGAKGPEIVEHKVLPKEEPQQETFRFTKGQTSSGPYEYPDIEIFNKPPPEARTYDRDSLIMNSRILEKKLLDFGVAGRVVTVHPGPVITMYEFEPASGIKLNRIVGLSDDLALALRALSIRIIAPLPGKSVVGIEVPNPERETVYIRDSLESESYRTASARLGVALGKDIFGTPIQTDLAKMPHLLVAGATGTGKSVFLNALLCSILFRSSPDDLKLLLIDPKLLELSIYEGIPHLVADVVTNPKRAAAALHGIVAKMEERYQMMSAVSVRSIDQFNAKVAEERAKGNNTFRLKVKPGEEEGVEVEYVRLPYILVVVDELADLMVVAGRDVEEALQRLAQMARAAGIHLVLATQRPSVDVLTGVIKANFPARISFQVSSRTDSRTILDQNGAEHLLGQGDMLFLPPGTSKMQRIHGAFVSEKEVGALVEFLRTQGTPEFDESLLKAREASEEKAKAEDVDEMYDRAIEIVAETRNASISYLQRRLKIGYNRAARIVENLEEEGVVGPQEGTKPREVFVRPLDHLE